MIPGGDEEPILRIAIASDLHAYVEARDTPAPSHFRVTMAESEPGKNPIAGLQRLVAQEGIQADLLLCPGDIAHQAQQVAIQHGWSVLHILSKDLKAKRLVATAGNHDLDSRLHSNEYDALEYLKNLSPPFPLTEEHLNDKFWARNFVIVEGDAYRIVVLNSSAYHTLAEERERGRVAEVTIARIREELDQCAPRLINILLCHHHPQQHMEVRLGDYDVMKNGQLLLDLLGSGKYGRWLLIHGHKHHPKLCYAAGGGVSPIVFSAGSLCASLYPELQSIARNQFHLISIPVSLIDSLGLVGVVQSWDWASGEGWAQAGAASGLPALCGFGYRGDPFLLAQKIAAEVTTEVREWKQIRLCMPEVDYLIPQDFAALRHALRTYYGLDVQEHDGRPRQIGRIS